MAHADPAAEIDGRSEEASVSWGSVILVTTLCSLTRYYVRVAVEPDWLTRGWMALMTCVPVFLFAALCLSLWNLRRRPWQMPKWDAVCMLTGVLLWLAIYGSWSKGGMPSSAAIQQVRADRGRQEELKAATADNRCPAGQRFAYGQCTKKAELYVRRNWLKQCPSGYVDHPLAPELCALPWAAERMRPK